MILLMLHDYPYVQCAMCLFKTAAMLFWLGHAKPLENKASNFMACIDEFVILLVFGGVCVFVRDDLEESTAKLIGWVIIGLLCTLILFNFIIIFKKIFETIVEKCKGLK